MDSRTPVENAIGATILLLPTQHTHVREMCGIYEKYDAVLDDSPMGAGKTRTAFAIAAVLGLPVFCVCPKGVATMWRTLARELGVPLVDVISYGMLRSRKNVRQLAHPWLIRKDKKSENGKRTITRFVPTPELEKIVAAGALFVFDEMHVTRGASGQTAACHGLMQAIHRRREDGKKGRSKVLAMSGTPSTDPIEICRHLRFLGVYTDERLSKMVFGAFTLLGGKDVIRAAYSMDSETTKKVIQETGQLKKNDDVVRLCGSLYKQVFMHHFVSNMPRPSNTATLIVSNALFKMDAFPADRRTYNSLIGALKKVAFEDNATTYTEDTIDSGKMIKGGAITLYHDMEVALVRTMVAHALAAYAADPRIKLSFMFSYTKSVELATQLLREALGEDAVGVVVGATPTEHDSNPQKLPTRSQIIARHNARYNHDVIDGTDEVEDDADEFEEDETEPTPTPSRSNGMGSAPAIKPIIALVGNMECLATGIDLDDKVGDEPRVAYLAFSPKVINLTQAPYRYSRVGSAGVATVRICHGFGEDGTNMPVMNALMRRSKWMRESLPNQVRDGMIFPGDYPIEIIEPVRE